MNVFTRTKPRTRDDAGYSVLVVMGFVLLLVSAILYTGFQVQSDALNGQSLAATSARHDALTAVAVAGVQSIRYSPLIGGGQTLPGPGNCFGAGTSSVTANTFTATAYCSTSQPITTNITGYTCTSPAVLSGTNCVTTTSTGTTSTPATPVGTSTRNVTLVACTSGNVTSCEANPELTVTTTFTDDQIDTATNTTNCAAVCGRTETIGVWEW